VPDDAVPMEDKGQNLDIALGDEADEVKRNQIEKEKSDGYFSTKEFDVEIGNKGGNNSIEKMTIDKKLSQPLHVHSQSEVQIGTVVDIERGSSSSEDNSDPSSGRKKKTWERLPVATPVFDAEVVVWNFDRPEYKHRFGKGFQDPEKKKNKEEQPNEPIFTEKDKSNIFRFIGKLIGIILALPLYFIYWLITFGWVSPLLCLADTILARPIGLAIDYALYIITTIVWVFFLWVLVPFYKCALVYPGRMLCKFTLASITLFLMTCDWLIETFVATISYIVASVCCQCLLKGISRTFKCMGENLIIRPIKCITSIPSLFVAHIARPIFKYMIKPFCEGILGGWLCIWGTFGKIAKFAKSSILLPCYQFVRSIVLWIYANIFKRIYGGFISGLKCMYEWILQPIGRAFVCFGGAIASGFKCICIGFWEGFVSGLKCMYEWILQPIGRAFVCFGGAIASGFKCICIGFWEGFVSGLKCMYEWILQPIGKGFMNIVKALYFAFTWILSSIRDFVIKPIGNALLSIFRALYRFIIVPIGSFISWITSLLASTIKGIGSLIQNIFVGIVNAFSAILGAIHRFIIVPIGSFISWITSLLASTIKGIGSLIQNIFVGIVNAFSAILGAIHRFIIVPIGSFISSIVSFFASVVKHISSVIQSIFSSIGSFVAAVGRSILALFGGR